MNEAELVLLSRSFIIHILFSFGRYNRNSKDSVSNFYNELPPTETFGKFIDTNFDGCLSTREHWIGCQILKYLLDWRIDSQRMNMTNLCCSK